MKFPTDQDLLNKCKMVVDQIVHKLNQSDDPHTDLLSEDSNDLSKVFRFHVPILRRWLDPYGMYVLIDLSKKITTHP